MKKILFFTLVMISIQMNAQVNINGYLSTDNRFRIQQNGKITWNENRLGLKFEDTPSDNIHYYSEVRLRGFGIPTVSTMSDLQSRSKQYIQPLGLELREAYIDAYGLFTDDLDVRFGRQRIAWGTADGVNPTDNINPDDLEDIFNFGEHLGSDAVSATYYLDDFTFQGVYVPVFTPAALPFGDWITAFTPDLSLPPGITIGEMDAKIILPENVISETQSFAFKVGTNLLDYDLSFSYYNGRDDLPLLTNAVLTPIDTLGTVSANTEMSFPRIQVVGADFAGSLGDVGFWGEGALFFPQKTFVYVTFPHPEYGMVTQQEVALDDKPYFKYIVGADYTFTNGWYINGQFLHGFVHERSSENLNDYLLIRFEKRFLNDALKIIPFGIALSVTDWENIEDNYGVAGGPEIDYYPFDGLEIALGAYLIDGKGNNLFSNVKDFDEVFVKVRYDF